VQRRGYATGAALVAVLAVGSVGCTGDSGSGGATADSKPGSVSAEAATAPPGTYRDLPEPCGTVGLDVLRAMLPGAGGGDAPEDGGEGDETPAAYEGERTVTYDNDRRVGCRWKSSTGLGSRHLLVDFERVVSYDPAVSDDERAERLYEDMVAEAGIPASPPANEGAPESPKSPGTAESSRAPEGPKAPEESETPETGTARPEADAGKTGEPDVPARPSASAAELAPRPLDGIGDAAYIDDELVTAGSGVHRDITLVFRTGNVIVTVEYEQWATDKRRLPDSAELQQKARTLAGRLAEEFDD